MKKTMSSCTAFLFLVLSSHAFGNGAVPPAEPFPRKGQEIPVEELRQGLQQAFGDLMGAMGAVTSGMAEGMRQGADALQSELDGLDGSRVVSSAEELRKTASVRVHEAVFREGKWHVTLAVRNGDDRPLRLTGLNRGQQVLLLDKEGFAHAPEAGLVRTLSVPAKAAVKQTFVFSGLEGRPESLRLYGIDFPVNGAPALHAL